VLRTLLGLLCLSAVAGCLQVRYVAQASLGQLELVTGAEDISDVLANEETDERTRVVLTEVERVLEYAAAHGLSTKGNYEKYVDVPRDAVVWFMTTSQPLAFEPVVWGFPIVGSFPYLGWFDYNEALKIRKRLERDGLDVYVRRVRAYSTGGWFRDPVLSTMISPASDALRSLANVLLHELTHANILVNDQATFNESLASFVGDTMAAEYLVERFGTDSEEATLFVEELAAYKAYGRRLSETYQQLNSLYESDRPAAEKVKEKERILLEVERELDMIHSPNNASLMGFKTYNVGIEDFSELYSVCGKSWPRFFAAIDGLDPDWFPEEQSDKVAEVVQKLVRARCRSKKS